LVLLVRILFVFVFLLFLGRVLKLFLIFAEGLMVWYVVLFVFGRVLLVLLVFLVSRRIAPCLLVWLLAGLFLRGLGL